MTADCNGWADMPEDQRERLELCDRPCGCRIADTRDRIIHSREAIRTSRLRIARRGA